MWNVIQIRSLQKTKPVLEPILVLNRSWRPTLRLGKRQAHAKKYLPNAKVDAQKFRNLDHRDFNRHY